MTTTTSTPKVRRIKSGVNGKRIGAVIAQFFSWLTTYWCVVWIAQPQAADLPLTVLISIVLEVLLITIKSLLFDASSANDVFGWAGFVVDAFINAGGIIPGAGRFLLWPPIAAILTICGITIQHERTNQIGALIIALIGGALLSMAPHRLWRAGGRSQEE